MADKTVVIEGTDLLSFGANFSTQSSSSSAMQDYAQALDSLGNSECEAALNNRTEYSQEVVYCNASPTLVAHLATFLTTFGQVQNAKAVDTLSIMFAPGEHATISATAHNHDSNEHTALNSADISTVIPASSGLGVPDIWANSNTDATPVSVTVSASMNHVDRNGATGEHWFGQSVTFRVDVTAEYINVPVLTTTGWSIDSEDSTDENQDGDGYSITAHKYFDRIAPA